MKLSERINETVAYLRGHVHPTDAIGVVLGTGLGGFVDEMEVDAEIPYSDIPHFPQSTVEGHDGRLIYGRMEGQNILALKGRFHFYEGYSMREVTFPIRVMQALGIQSVLLSNASGGVNPDFKVGDIMVIRDHINLFPSNPLIGANEDELGPRFPDMSEPYDKTLMNAMHLAAREVGIHLKEGVYAGVPGPCYETPAEYKYIRIIGADAVGMSTIPETIVARHAGMKVVALSIITDLGVEGHVESISHEEVQSAAEAAEPKMAKVVRQFLASHALDRTSS